MAAVLFATIFLLGCVSPTPTGPAEPKISVSPEAWDFGEMPSETVSKTFTLQNSGTLPLEIKRLSTSCGCTTATVGKDNLQPGELTDLVVQFDPNAMETPVVGKVLRIVYIKSNDPNLPELEIEITANVQGVSA